MVRYVRILFQTRSLQSLDILLSEISFFSIQSGKATGKASQVWLESAKSYRLGLYLDVA